MELRRLILQKIAELDEATLDSFFPAKYPEARIWHDLLKTRPSYKFSKPTFSAILSQLRKQGLVERKGSRKTAAWRITRGGQKFLQENRSPSKPVRDGIMRIICFDIPEEQRKKRRWIREALLGSEYQQLQKSVWIGFAPLPENFFEDLDLMALRNYVHIFSVGQKGTLNKA